MSPTEALHARYGSAYRWFATAAALIASISVILSATIVNVAVPAVMGAFGIDQTKAQWLSTGFLAAMTATMLLTDWATRAFGERGAMTAALVLFTAGSVLGGIAPDENVLIAARIIQGAAAGIVQPLAMLIVFQVFPPERRSSAMALYGIGVVLAPALGPWVGGLLMDSLDWRYVFYLGVPFAALAIALSLLFLPAREHGHAPPRFDWIGFGLMVVFLTTLLGALSSGQRTGWGSDAVLLELAVSALAFAGFILWERHTPRPMLDLGLFARGAFTAAAVVSFVLGAGLFGTIYLLPVFVQTIQGMTPTQAGLLMMPAGLVLVLVFPLAGRLGDRLPPAVPIAAGLIVFAWSSWLTSHANVHTSFWALAWWTLLSRIGMGLVFPALSAGSLRALPPQMLAQGSGAINFTRQLGGAFGVNLLAVMVERRTVFHAEGLADALTPDNAVAMSFLEQVAAAVRGAGLPESQQGPAATWFLGETVYQQASTLAFRDGFLVVAVVFVAALVPTWLLRASSPHSPHGPRAV